MSAKFFQSDTPQENQFIKCNDITCRGHLVIDEYATVGGNLTVTGAETVGGALTLAANTDVTVGGTITLPAMTVYTQATSQTTTVSISGAEQQFIVDTFAGSIPAGTAISFNINNASIQLNKTLIVVTKMGSTTALTNVNDFVSVTAAGGMTLTRHNFGSGAAVGLQRLCFKLIQTA